MIFLLFHACADFDAAPSAQDENGYRARDKETPAEEGWSGAAPSGGSAAPSPLMAESEPAMDVPMDGRMGMLVEKKNEASGGAKGGEASAPTRAWFPESFLWMPIVQTDGAGVATVDVHVPDSLTTWRILALGVTKAGAQAGSVVMVQSTLPAYVDVVTPPFLYAGDRWTMPVQVVNQTGSVLTSKLEVTVRGGTGAGGGAVSVPAYGSKASTVAVAVSVPGTLGIRAALGDVDAVEKSVVVRPVGRPVDVERGGSLAGPRDISLPAIPGGTYGTLTVTAFPGALGVVRAEIDAVDARDDSSLDHAAYAYALTMAAAGLDPAEVDAERLRAVRLRAWQRLARSGRAPDASAAAVLVLGLEGAAEKELSGKLRSRAVDVVTAAQQDDGLWGLYGGATIDQVLVQSAICAMALRDDDAVRLRVGGAFARNVARLEDPWLAAWVLASGAAEPELAARLKDTVKAALATAEDGSRYLPGGGIRADGGVTTDAEATAVAALALAEDATLAADLGTSLLTHYSAARGFGRSFCDLMALRALKTVFVGEIPASVAVRVEVDGVVVAQGALNPAQPHAPITLRADVAAGAHAVRVVSEPAVPGLAFSLVERQYVGWKKEAPAGLDLAIDRPSLTMGHRWGLNVSVAAPAGQTVNVDVGLPAGVAADAQRMDALVAGGQIVRWRGEEGTIHLSVLAGNGAWAGQLPVVASLAGSLQTGPSRAWVAGREGEAFTRVPETWVIR